MVLSWVRTWQKRHIAESHSILSGRPVNLSGRIGVHAKLGISESISTTKESRGHSSPPLILEFSLTRKDIL